MTGTIIERERDVEAKSDAMSIAQSRQAQEVQAAMLVAKRFPRDVDAATRRILDACKRPALAESSSYEYKKGTSIIEGPSIRLAEVIAQNWGNIDFGIVELARARGVSSVQAYAWDLETNTRSVKVFDVRHWRDTNSGGYALTDERDIYETVANQGARRLRAAILSVIPGDVVQAAQTACDATLTNANSKVPLGERVEKMRLAFNELGVSRERLELKLQHPLTLCTEREIIKLGKLYAAIRDGITTAAEQFPDPATAAKSLGDVKSPLASQDSPPPSQDKPATSHDNAQPSQDKPATVAAFAAYVLELNAARSKADATAVRDRWYGPDSTREFEPGEATAGDNELSRRCRELDMAAGFLKPENPSRATPAKSRAPKTREGEGGTT